MNRLQWFICAIVVSVVGVLVGWVVGGFIGMLRV